MKLDNENFDVKNYETILFDFDGVLAESMDVKTEAFRKLFEKFGQDIVNKVVKHHIENGGISRYKKIVYYYSEYLNKELSNDELEEIAKEFSNLVVEKVIDSDWVAGAKDFLEKYYNKIDLYIVSGTPTDELKIIVEKRNMEKYFKEIYGSPKNKEEVIDQILKKNQYGLDKTVFIGDTLSDHKAAIKTGVVFIGRVPRMDANPFPKNVKTINNFVNIS